jgi:hypothetical protein
MVVISISGSCLSALVLEPRAELQHDLGRRRVAQFLNAVSAIMTAKAHKQIEKTGQPFAFLDRAGVGW